MTWSRPSRPSSTPRPRRPRGRTSGRSPRSRAKDDGTVVFTLSAPYADLPVTLAYTNAKIVPASVDQIRPGTPRPRGDRHRPVQAGLVRARAAGRRCPQRRLLRSRAALCRPDPDRRLSRHHGRRLGADRRRHGYHRDAAADRVRAAAEGRAASRSCACRRASSAMSISVAIRSRSTMCASARRSRSPSTGRRWSISSLEGYGTPGNDTPLNSAYRYYSEPAAEKARHRPCQERCWPRLAIRTASMRR